jgi:hypothetical protein
LVGCVMRGFFSETDEFIDVFAREMNLH